MKDELEPLRNKGIVKNKHLKLKFFLPSGVEYTSKNTNWDLESHDVYAPSGELLTRKYFDEDGNEVKQTHFFPKEIKSAVEYYEKYGIGIVREGCFDLKENHNDIYKKCIKDIGEREDTVMWKANYQRWILNYTFGDVTE